MIVTSRSLRIHSDSQDLAAPGAFAEYRTRGTGPRTRPGRRHTTLSPRAGRRAAEHARATSKLFTVVKGYYVTFYYSKNYTMQNGYTPFASFAARSRSFCSSTVTIVSPDGPERQISESSRLIWFREVIFEKHLETSQNKHVLNLACILR